MKILKRSNDKIAGFASLANIGYDLYEVNLDGEVYKCSTSPRYRTDKYTWSKSSVDTRMKEPRDVLAMKCVKMFNEGMSYQAIADKLGFNSDGPVRTLIGTVSDLITRKTRKLDEDTIRSIYNDFMYTDKSNSEIAKQYNLSKQFISNLRTGYRCSDLAHEYITSKGLSGYWQGFRHPK